MSMNNHESSSSNYKIFDIFSRHYSTIHQRNFVEAVENNEFERAVGILESFPSPRTAHETVERLIVLNEGRSYLIDVLLFGDTKLNTTYKKIRASHVEKLKEKLQELRVYRQLGYVADLSSVLKDARFST